MSSFTVGLLPLQKALGPRSKEMWVDAVPGLETSCTRIERVHGYVPCTNRMCRTDADGRRFSCVSIAIPVHQAFAVAYIHMAHTFASS